MTPSYFLWLRKGLPGQKVELPEQAPRHQFLTCRKHGWEALDNPCPHCKNPEPQNLVSSVWVIHPES